MPPNRLFPFFVVITIDKILAPSPFEFYILLALSIPLAYLGRLIERHHRWQQNRRFDQVMELATNNKFVPLRKIKYIATLEYLFIHILAFFISYVAIYYLIHLIRFLSLDKDINQINWPLLWAISLIGGILSIRIKEAYLVLVSGFIVIGMVILLGV